MPADPESSESRCLSNVEEANMICVLISFSRYDVSKNFLVALFM